MEGPGHTIDLRFRHAHQRMEVAVDALVAVSRQFLEHYGEAWILGDSCARIVGDGGGAERFRRLLAACGCPDDPVGFFAVVARRLEEAGHRSATPVVVGDVALPYLLLLEWLKLLVPGSGCVSVKTVTQLRRLTNVDLREEEHAPLQQVLNLFPVRLSKHTIRQMRLSADIAMQYMPFVEELDPSGNVHTWVGQFHRGIVERMYANRCIFILHMACPVYCRFCFRKHKECRNQRPPTRSHVKEAVAYTRESPRVKEVVLTGGDPFMNRATLQAAIRGLSHVRHVETLRLATRSVSYYPQLFEGRDGYWMDFLQRANLDLAAVGKRLEIATHFIHPHEVGVEAMRIISKLVRSGIPVYIQTPFLKRCNESGTELVELFSRLRAVGAEMHYVYLPCSPIRGNRVYWAPVSSALRAANHLRANLSDRAIPHFTTATAIGKLDWNGSGWAVEEAEPPGTLWLRTPYTLDYYREFAPILQFGDAVRENDEGTLDVRFQADIGDPDLLQGPRHAFAAPPRADRDVRSRAAARRDHLAALQEAARQGGTFAASVAPTGNPALWRPHLTRAEIDLGGSPADVDRAFDRLREVPEVTDVVLFGGAGLLEAFGTVKSAVRRAMAVPNVRAVRLRSAELVDLPDQFGEPLVEALGALNRLEAADPKRLEVEVTFLCAEEVNRAHGRLAAALRRRGVTVYNTTPLLGRINDDGDEMLALADACRSAGIEFHEVCVAGLPHQVEWNTAHPVTTGVVIDVATAVRRSGSGREVPRYVVRTILGTVDFLYGCRFEGEKDGAALLRLLPYDLSWYRRISAGFRWPAGVAEAGDGHPIVPVRGLVWTVGEALTRP
jgi:lysine 2,3-aminomutase